MTTTARERPGTERGLAWDQRSLLPDRAGLPWWAAVALALVLTAVGAFADMERANRLGLVFQVAYFVGCLLAVAVVQRKGLFGPMVQPPLILAGMVPAMVLLAGSLPQDGGATAAALVVGTPLINNFPTMAVTTLATVAVGGLRLATQRRPADQGEPREPHRADPQPARTEPRRDRPRPSPRPRTPPQDDADSGARRSSEDGAPRNADGAAPRNAERRGRRGGEGGGSRVTEGPTPRKRRRPES